MYLHPAKSENVYYNSNINIDLDLYKMQIYMKSYVLVNI